MAKQRIIYLITLIVSFVLFVQWEDYFVHLLFYFLLLLPVVSLIVSLPLSFLLHCRLEAPAAVMSKNVPESFLFQVNNRYPVPAACIKATVVCKNVLCSSKTVAKEKIHFPAGFSAETSVPIRISFPYCGKITLHIRSVRVCDLLGLFCIPVLHKKFCATVYVMPDQAEIECEPESGVDLGQESTVYSDKKAGNDPAEIFRLRDYHPGDRPHAIHWKLSNRFDRLLVREFGLPLNVSVRFLIETGGNTPLHQIDCLLEAFFSLADFLAQQGMIQTVNWLSSCKELETRTVADEDALAEILHEVLAMPSVQETDGALKALVMQEEAPLRCHLIYLAAVGEDCAPVPLLTGLLHNGVCRRISILAAGRVHIFDELQEEPGCEVYSLQNGVMDAGLEQMRV